MRTLCAMLTALWLGGCAAQPPTLTDIVAQIRSDFVPSRQSCVGRSSNNPGQAHLPQGNCFAANPVAQSKSSVPPSEAHTKRRLASVPSPVFNALGRAPPPKLDGRQQASAEGVPTLNSEATCHLADNLAVDQNVSRCLMLETKAHDQLAHSWADFPSDDRSHCVRYSAGGGGGTYTDLLTCLEMERHARDLHTKSRSVANQ
jgi:hypothetical protein